MEEKIIEFAEKIHLDGKKSKEKLLELSKKLNNSNFNKDIILEIRRLTNNKAFCDFQLAIIDLYVDSLLFYMCFINNEDILMEETEKKIKKKILNIKNDINCDNYFMYDSNNEYLNEFNKALMQVENIMYFRDCKINNYKYLIYLEEFEIYINDLKKQLTPNKKSNL